MNHNKTGTATTDVQRSTVHNGHKSPKSLYAVTRNIRDSEKTCDVSAVKGKMRSVNGSE